MLLTVFARCAGTGLLIASLVAGVMRAARAAEGNCVAPMTYIALDSQLVGKGEDGVAALGTYERVSPDGRFILRSYSGARLGKVSLIELPLDPGGRVQAHVTPLSNEAFPVQGTWRYIVDVTGEHYRLADILRLGRQAKPLFKGGMTGFYAAASELVEDTAAVGDTADQPPIPASIRIRSLSWPQDVDPDRQGVGPLQVATVTVRDDGSTARVVETIGPRFICGDRRSIDGNAFALPMISVDGSEFSAIPQAPHVGAPSMRVYRLSQENSAEEARCDLVSDLGLSPSKAVFGFPPADGAAWLVYSDLGHVYVFDRSVGQAFRLDHAMDGVLASAFPGLTRDGRVIYAATWRTCADRTTCPSQAGYVVVDPYQSSAYRAYWHRAGRDPPKACVTTAAVREQRLRFGRFHGLDP